MIEWKINWNGGKTRVKSSDLGSKNGCRVEGTGLRDTWNRTEALQPVRFGWEEEESDSLSTSQRIRRLLQRPSFRGRLSCVLSQSEGTGGSNGEGKLRSQTENGLWASHSGRHWSVAPSLTIYHPADHGPFILSTHIPKWILCGPSPCQPQKANTK